MVHDKLTQMASRAYTRTVLDFSLLNFRQILDFLPWNVPKCAGFRFGLCVSVNIHKTWIKVELLLHRWFVLKCLFQMWQYWIDSSNSLAVYSLSFFLSTSQKNLSGLQINALFFQGKNFYHGCYILNAFSVSNINKTNPQKFSYRFFCVHDWTKLSEWSILEFPLRKWQHFFRTTCTLDVVWTNECRNMSTLGLLIKLRTSASVDGK